MIMNCDALEGIKRLDDESVDLIFTSPNPPFFYTENFNDNVIGTEATIAGYIGRLTHFFNLAFRVLKDDGNICVVMADYHRSGSLTLAPTKFAEGMITDCDYFLRSHAIWHKPHKAPQEENNRLKRDYEHMFFFSKLSDNYWYKIDETSVFRYPLDPIRPGEEGVKSGFPEELIADIILMACPPRGTVLDPFAGVGTTGVVARRLKRPYIMMDINPHACEVMKEKKGLI